MDPLSLAFASYLDLVVGVTHNKLEDVMGVELTAMQVEHKHVVVPYSYQMWRIQEPTVCVRYKPDLAVFSQCTRVASDLFSQVCAQLQTKRLTHWKQKKLKNMYCQAAVSFKPTVASVQWSPANTELQEARSACNAAIAASMGNGDMKLREEKERLCAQYDQLKKSSAD